MGAADQNGHSPTSQGLFLPGGTADWLGHGHAWCIVVFGLWAMHANINPTSHQYTILAIRNSGSFGKRNSNASSR